jgi:uncharacterized membrane protein
MGNPGAFIFLGAVAGLAVVVWGAFQSGRSIVVAAVCAVVALPAAVCSWYAYAESQSLPWTIGYGLVVLLSLFVGMKQVFGSRSTSDHDLL